MAGKQPDPMKREMAHYHDLLPGSDAECFDAVMAALAKNAAVEEYDHGVVLWSCLQTMGNAFPDFLDILFSRIAHGDDSHKAWLKDEISKWFTGELI